MVVTTALINEPSKTNHLDECCNPWEHSNFLTKHKFMQTGLQKPMNQKLSTVETVVKKKKKATVKIQLYIYRHVGIAQFYLRYPHGVGRYDSGCLGVPPPSEAAPSAQELPSSNSSRLKPKQANLCRDFTWFWWDLLLTRLCRKELPELPVPKLPYIYTDWLKSSSPRPSLSGTEWSLWHTTYAHIHLLQHVLFSRTNKAIPASSEHLQSGVGESP